MTHHQRTPALVEPGKDAGRGGRHPLHELRDGLSGPTQPHRLTPPQGGQLVGELLGDLVAGQAVPPSDVHLPPGRVRFQGDPERLGGLHRPLHVGGDDQIEGPAAEPLGDPGRLDLAAFTQRAGTQPLYDPGGVAG